jgi:hypothetical protein
MPKSQVKQEPQEESSSYDNGMAARLAKIRAIRSQGRLTQALPAMAKSYDDGPSEPREIPINVRYAPQIRASNRPAIRQRRQTFGCPIGCSCVCKKGAGGPKRQKAKKKKTKRRTTKKKK